MFSNRHSPFRVSIDFDERLGELKKQKTLAPKTYFVLSDYQSRFDSLIETMTEIFVARIA